MKTRFILILISSFLCATINSFAQNGLEFPKTNNDEIILNHTGFSLSYNPKWMIPSWVAYELSASNMEGDAIRARSFSPDPSPELEGYPLAQHWHYTYSGWVRGHMVPAGDLKYSQHAMNDSFYTTNICPMNLEFNNGIWKRLEEKIRRLALDFGRVYIITGPIVDTNHYGKVGESDIVVPDAFYKAILIPYKNSFLSIGFLLNNEPAPKGSRLRDYALTVKELESLTGMDFFYALSNAESETVENLLPLKELGLY